MNQITRKFRKVRPHVVGEVQCIDCGHRWEVTRDGAALGAAEKAALAEECPMGPHHHLRVPKTKLGTVKVRRCADCTESCQCTWRICPYSVDVDNETDHGKAMWLCEDCEAGRAADI